MIQTKLYNLCMTKGAILDKLIARRIFATNHLNNSFYFMYCCFDQIFYYVFIFYKI